MKNILVTGGCGFIGSNVINYLVTKYRNINIFNIDRLDYCASLDNITVSNCKNYRFFKGDINSHDLVNHILNEYNIDTVIHFAAQSHVSSSFGNSLQFTKDNVLGTHSLLECCRVFGNITRFIHISTDEVFGEIKLDDPACLENALLQPTNPYACSKAAAEFMVKSYWYSYKLPIIIVRMNNVLGPRQYPEKLIPKFIMLLLNNKKCTIEGIGNNRRNFIHVDDVSSALDIILFKAELGETYNIGTNNEYSVNEITQKLINILKPGELLENNIEYIQDRNFNDFRYSVNSDKIKKLGWKEKVNFDDGLLRTVEWYKNKFQIVQ
ncbi:MAG: putative dTDP-D-glucose 46-dehydratase [Edafosvirus sp.]|uniref:Putative dTDP-D-glucose 46-dehydratase n=1 Tax=Edafosvirus sp. TaxID=2487765 RepID=A0A3G4ZXD9_9VIRU|nr:MAG: putative dTDP-D-glucose 46-dehydratase [Edafosvirus sp.]